MSKPRDPAEREEALREKHARGDTLFVVASALDGAAEDILAAKATTPYVK